MSNRMAKTDAAALTPWHSPTPWRLAPNTMEPAAKLSRLILAGDSKHPPIVAETNGEPFRSEELQGCGGDPLANAEFIVTACNLHAELVAACDKSRDRILTLAAEMGDDADPLLHELDTVLARVRKGGAA